VRSLLGGADPSLTLRLLWSRSAKHSLYSKEKPDSLGGWSGYGAVADALGGASADCAHCIE
jgi:hypothetical protein